MVFTGRQNEVALYYLCMSADGIPAKEEMTLFDRLCGEMRLTEEEKRAVTAQVDKWLEDAAPLEIIRERRLAEELSRCPEDALEELTPLRNSLGMDQEGFREMLNEGIKRHGSPALARHIWNLMMLSYADGRFSREESAIISYLMKEWKLDWRLHREISRAADTVWKLMGQREWAESHLSGEEARRKIEELDKQIAWIGESVETSIEEMRH